MEPKPTIKNMNKPAYLVFLLVGVIFIILRDFSQAVIFWGLALVFDPFNINTSFKNRPVYQQLWLYIHLSVTIVLFVLLLMEK